MYSRFGPSARVVFKMKSEARSGQVYSALRAVNDPSQLFPDDDNWDDTIGNALIVMEPWSDDSRIRAVGRVATPYIMDLAMERAKKMMAASMRRTYGYFLGNPEFRVPVGMIFEAFAHHVFGSYNSPLSLKLLLPSAAGTPATRLDFTMTSSPVIFDSAQGLHNIEERTYYRPLQSNFAGVDAFTVTDETLVYLQFTVSHQHPIEAKGLRLIRKLVPAELWNRCMVVFVVPPETVPGFERQPFTPPTDRPQWSEDMPQFVASLSADELFGR